MVNPNQAGGGQICPTDFQMIISLEPKVGLTSNQAVNSSLSVVSRSKKKLTDSDHEKTLQGPFMVQTDKFFYIGL